MAPHTNAHSSPANNIINLEEDTTTALAEVARLKRQLAASNQQLAEATNAKVIQPPTTTSMGRGIRKLVTLYELLSNLIDEADQRVLEQEGTPRPTFALTDDEEVEIQRARNHTFTSYNLLLRLVPQLKNVIQDPNMATLTQFLTDVLVKLQDGANGARSDDIRRIKEEVGNWINQGYAPQVLLDPKTRYNRGLQHDICGKLLTPLSSIGITPRFAQAYAVAWKDGHATPSDIEHLFLRSRLLLQTYCAIFTSPSSAEGFDDETKATKNNVATLLNMDGRVTGRSIAYAAVLLVFNLTDAHQWKDVYNGSNFVAFYNFLVDYFEDTPDATSKMRVNSLLAWWNQQIFPHHVGASTDPRSSHKRLAAQRASKQTRN
ncbi:hypothetical protein BD779DRAFT_1685585 [Infundibulicybe gibba]|nr:hypothetical protein BD779DRAFT_1685585 [Infundibulicybe gibba]